MHVHVEHILDHYVAFNRDGKRQDNCTITRETSFQCSLNKGGVHERDEGGLGTLCDGC